ncbi:MAG: TonB-dependent receptor [Gammaproteobacteria bacterium]|nr:TonB-dependent receptor [Gammaproteobacteria bacterium]
MLKRLLPTAAIAAHVPWVTFGAELAIEEVVVTASRLGAVDQRVIVIDEDDVDGAAFHAADSLRALPGLALATNGHRGSLTQARVRGAESNHLLVLLDGVALNDPALASEFNFGVLDFAGVQRVEYLAGPQSAVWGNDALAGVLYLDTTPRRDSSRYSLGFGSHGTIDADIEFARVSEDRHAALSVGRVSSDGTNPAAMGDEDDGFANTTAHLNLGASRDRWQVAVAARFTDFDVDYDPTPAPRYLPADGDRQASGHAAVVLATVHFNASDNVETWLTLSSSQDRNKQFADGTFTDGTVGRRDTATLATNFHFDTQRVNVTAEVERERIEQTGSASFFGDPNQRQRISAQGIAAEYQVELGRFGVSVSARTDSNDAFDDAFTYRLGTTFGENPRLFANIGRGVKNPTFTERFGFTPDTFIGNPDLAPETSTGFETGMVVSRGETTASLVYFDTTLDDEIDGFFFDVDRGGFSARNLDGQSRRKGAEATLDTRLGRVALGASYAYVDTTAEDVRELRRPRHLGNVDARVQISPRMSANLGITVSGASLDRDFSTWPATDVELGSYRLWRGSLDLALSPRWNVSVGAENLFDEDYVTVYGYRSPGFTAMAKAVFSP